MKTFEVTLPVNGIVYVTVEAETEEAAIDEALNTYGPTDLETWSAYRHLLQGNVFYGECSEALAEEVT